MKYAVKTCTVAGTKNTCNWAFEVKYKILYLQLLKTV